MKSYLLPYRFKRIGMYMFIPFCAVCLWCIFSGEYEFNYLEWPCISVCFQEILDENPTWFTIDSTDPINEIGMLGLLISLCFIALAKEKDEDEMTSQIRMQSFVWALWIEAAVIAFCILFVYGIRFMEFAFISIFLIFVIYIIKFNLTMRRIKRESK